MSEPRPASPAVDTLEQLTQLIGEEATVALSVRYGGRRLYVPKDSGRAGEISQLIGPKPLELLVRRFGGMSIEMPLERGKRQRIILLTHRGKSSRQIAEIVGCTERHVKYVRAEYREHGGDGRELPPETPSPQTDLFAESPAPSPSPVSDQE